MEEKKELFLPRGWVHSNIPTVEQAGVLAEYLYDESWCYVYDEHAKVAGDDWEQDEWQVWNVDGKEYRVFSPKGFETFIAGVEKALNAPYGSLLRQHAKLYTATWENDDGSKYDMYYYILVSTHIPKHIFHLDLREENILWERDKENGKKSRKSRLKNLSTI